MPNVPARTYINWEVDRIVIFTPDRFSYGEEYGYGTRFVPVRHSSGETISQLHDDDRSAAYGLAKKLAENGLKFVAVNTRNKSAKIEVSFRLYILGGARYKKLFSSILEMKG